MSQEDYYERTPDEEALIKEVRDTLRYAIRDRGVTMKRLASDLGVELSTVRKCLCGKGRNMKLLTMHDIANAIDCKVVIRLEDKC